MKRLFPALPLLIISLTAFGQENTVSEKVRFGFSLAINQAAIPSLSQKGTGFSLCTCIEYRLTNKVFFYPRPMLSFLSMHYKDKRIEATELEIPLHILYKPFDCSYLPQISLGPNYKMDLANNAAGSPYRDLYTDLAFGFELTLDYFTLTPEFCYSWNKSMQTVYLSLYFKG